MNRNNTLIKPILLHAVGPSERPKGAVVMVHGLNVNPRAMAPMAQLANESGLDALVVSLTGHDGYNLRAACLTSWRDDVSRAIDFAISRYEGSCHLLGFSMGGALLVDWLLGRTDFEHFRSMTLLAPALVIKEWTNWYKPLTLVQYPLLSGMPLPYRASRWTMSSWFRSLFELEKDLNKKSLEGPALIALQKLPTTIFISSKDEFISIKALKKWCSQRNLSSWTIEQVERVGPLTRFPYHLILDNRGLGEAGFEFLKTKVSQSWAVKA